MATNIQYSPRTDRFFAYMLDGIFLLLPNVLLLALLGKSGMALLAMFLVTMAYHTYCVASVWQATPGKRLLNLFVVMSDGRKPTQLEALERSIVAVLPTLPMYTSVLSEHIAQTLFMWLTMVWFAPILYTPERRGVHDTLVGTRVIVGKVG